MASRSVAVLAAAATVLAFWFPVPVIGLVGGLALLLLAFPLLREYRAGRPLRCQRIVDAWQPEDARLHTFGFLFGGPGRLTDLLLVELEKAGKLTLSKEGMVQFTGERPSYAPIPGLGLTLGWRELPDLTRLRRSLHKTVLYQHYSRGQVSARELRRIVAAGPEIGLLWYRLAKAGLVSSRRQLRWIYKGLRVSVGMLAIPLMVATVVLLTRTNPPPIAWVLLLVAAVATVTLGDAYLRAIPRRLTGFHTDLRTKAGRRASELVDAGEDDPDLWRVARFGLPQLRPTAGGPEPSWWKPSYWWVVPVDSSRPSLFHASRWQQRAKPHQPIKDASDGSSWQAASELGSSWIGHYGSSQGDGGSDVGSSGGGGGGDGDVGGDWN